MALKVHLTSNLLYSGFPSSKRLWKKVEKFMGMPANLQGHATKYMYKYAQRLAENSQATFRASQK